MFSPIYSMSLASDRRVSAAARFHAEQEEQTKRRGNLSRRLGPVFAEMAAQAANAQQGPQIGPARGGKSQSHASPYKACKPAHGGDPA